MSASNVRGRTVNLYGDLERRYCNARTGQSGGSLRVKTATGRRVHTVSERVSGRLKKVPVDQLHDLRASPFRDLQAAVRGTVRCCNTYRNSLWTPHKDYRGCRTSSDARRSKALSIVFPSPIPRSEIIATISCRHLTKRSKAMLGTSYGPNLRLTDPLTISCPSCRSSHRS